MHAASTLPAAIDRVLRAGRPEVAALLLDAAAVILPDPAPLRLLAARTAHALGQHQHALDLAAAAAAHAPDPAAVLLHARLLGEQPLAANFPQAAPVPPA